MGKGHKRGRSSAKSKKSNKSCTEVNCNEDMAAVANVNTNTNHAATRSRKRAIKGSISVESVVKENDKTKVNPKVKSKVVVVPEKIAL